MPGKGKILLSCLSGAQLPLPCPHLWCTAWLTLPCHPSPRADTLLPNQLLKLVTEILDGSLPFLLQKIVSHEGVAPKRAHYLSSMPMGLPLPFPLGVPCDHKPPQLPAGRPATHHSSYVAAGQLSLAMCQASCVGIYPETGQSYLWGGFFLMGKRRGLHDL